MRTVVLTGATGAIGAEIAVKLAGSNDVQLVLAVRDEARGRALAERCAGLGAQTRVEYVDLESRRSVRHLASRLDVPVHTLVNNAAVGPPAREVTEEGIERVLATNVLSYLWLAEALRPQLREAGGARIVNVASYWAGDLDVDDLEFDRRPYDNNGAYRQSKQANRMLTVRQADDYRDDGIDVHSCHPGDVNSRLSNDLGFGGSMSARQGAQTPAWLALAPDVGPSGGYFAHRERAHCEFAQDRAAIDALHQRLQAYG